MILWKEFGKNCMVSAGLGEHANLYFIHKCVCMYVLKYFKYFDSMQLICLEHLWGNQCSYHALAPSSIETFWCAVSFMGEFAVVDTNS